LVHPSKLIVYLDNSVFSSVYVIRVKIYLFSNYAIEIYLDICMLMHILTIPPPPPTPPLPSLYLFSSLPSHHVELMGLRDSFDSAFQVAETTGIYYCAHSSMHSSCRIFISNVLRGSLNWTI
jgi:hypothetical protein